jgi:hypothetical protein
VKLEKDGSATIELTQEFHGKYAVSLREAFDEMPENRMHDVLEGQVLGRMLRGAVLEGFKIEHQGDLDKPLLLRMTAKMANFAQVHPGELVFAPPFVPGLSQLAQLNTRTTPLLIGTATHQIVDLHIKLPAGATTQVTGPQRLEHGDRSVQIRDTVEPGMLNLNRVVELTAGRVKPDAYPAFVRFARGADSVLSREIRVQIGGGKQTARAR